MEKGIHPILPSPLSPHSFSLSFLIISLLTLQSQFAETTAGKSIAYLHNDKPATKNPEILPFKQIETAYRRANDGAQLRNW